MARIEKGREATRDALLTAIDGTDWAKVTLEPSNWAQLCREKAIAWKTRNPTNPAHLQLRLESLKRMKQAYEVYNEQLASRSQPRQPQTTLADAKTALEKVETAHNTEKKDHGSETEQSKRLELAKASKKALVDALQKVVEANSERDTANTTYSGAAEGSAKSDAQVELDKADKKLAQAQEEAVIMESVASIRQEQIIELKLALEAIYKHKTEERRALEADNAVKIDSPAKSESAARVRNAKDILEAAKERWLIAKHALQAIGTTDSVSSLEAVGISTMKIAISGHLKSLESDISTTQAQLFSTTAGLGDAPSTIIGVTDNKALIRTSGDTAENPESATTASTEESADAWTKVVFSVGSTSSSSSTQELNISGSASLEVGRWWTSVKASTSFSSSSKKVESAMASCRVEGSFSAIVVNIKRPWLHGDLFQDFDIDISDDSKLSPGAEQIETWVDQGDPGGKRTDYGKFPAYPTAFIVAADTVLEFKSNTQNSVEMMTALSTDSSIQASYGPWGLKGGATAKTDNKDSSQKMGVKDGGLRIAFQAPQIIGWVSEILPQLPRGSKVVRGGLTAAPLMAFRN